MHNGLNEYKSIQNVMQLLYNFGQVKMINFVALIDFHISNMS